MVSKTRGSGTLVKYLLFFFNTLFVLLGMTLLVFSVWALADEKSLRPVMKTRVFVSLALAALGVAITTICVALLGCFGAIKEIKWVVIIFSGFLLFFLVVTLSGVVTLYIFRTVVGREIESAMATSLKTDYFAHPTDQESTAIKDSWDWLQQTLHCCGVSGNISAPYYTWQTSRWFLDPDRSPGLVPSSCCVPSGPGIVVDASRNDTFRNRAKCLAIDAFADFRGPPRSRIAGGMQTANDALFIDGCYHAFRRLLADDLNLVIVVCSVVALLLVEVIGLGLACHLCRRLKSYNQMHMESFSKGKRF